VFISTVLAGQLIGLKQEGLLRWRARFFGVELAIIEIAPLGYDLGVPCKKSID
jgi:hypothetical protein